jgi:hypothetical protein
MDRLHPGADPGLLHKSMRDPLLPIHFSLDFRDFSQLRNNVHSLLFNRPILKLNHDHLSNCSSLQPWTFQLDFFLL